MPSKFQYKIENVIKFYTIIRGGVINVIYIWGGGGDFSY